MPVTSCIRLATFGMLSPCRMLCVITDEIFRRYQRIALALFQHIRRNHNGCILFSAQSKCRIFVVCDDFGSMHNRQTLRLRFTHGGHITVNQVTVTNKAYLDTQFTHCTKRTFELCSRGRISTHRIDNYSHFLFPFRHRAYVNYCFFPFKIGESGL